jgi:hypothetical protein
MVMLQLHLGQYPGFHAMLLYSYEKRTKLVLVDMATQLEGLERL